MKKKKFFKYSRVKDLNLRNAMQTESRSKSDSGISFKQHSEVNQIVHNMIKPYLNQFVAAGFDPYTIKFQIALSDG